MAGSAIRAGQVERQEEGRSPRAPPAKRAAPLVRSLHGGGGGAGGGGKDGAASPAPSSGGGGGGAAAAGAAAASSSGSPAIPPYLKTFRAEDGLLLYAPSPSDALAEAISNKECQVYYGKGRVALRQGDIVLDLGANVGSFARMAAPLIGPKGCVYAVEPIDEVVEALGLNARLYASWTERRGIEAAPIVPVHAGVGTAADAARGRRRFAYYPRVTAMSSMYPDEEDATAATFSLVIHRPECFSVLEAAAKPLARCAPALYRLVHGAVFRRALLRPVRVVECPMLTVSDLIDRHAIHEVGLLKANVERAEWDVLLGVREEHWPRVRQVSLQVHDVRGRVGRTRQFLARRGFSVCVYKEPRFAECCLHMVYGVRGG